MSPRRSSGYLNVLLANPGTKAVSLLVAIVLWFVVLGSRNVEETKEVPVEILTPTDLVPSNDVPDRIAFRLSGPKAFLRAVLDRREEPIRVNLAGAKPGLVTYRFFSDNIRLPIGVKVLSINPTAILVKLETVRRKEVPVRLIVRGAPPEGYRLVKAELFPSSVKIRGPESRVDSLQELLTVPVDLSNLRSNVERDATLDLTFPNLQLDGLTPKLLVQVEPVSANYRIKNVEVRVVGASQFKLEEKTVTVLVRAAPQDLVRLDRSRVFATVEAKPTKGKQVLPVKVNLPEGVGLVKVVPDHVRLSLY